MKKQTKKKLKEWVDQQNEDTVLFLKERVSEIKKADNSKKGHLICVWLQISAVMCNEYFTLNQVVRKFDIKIGLAKKVFDYIERLPNYSVRKNEMDIMIIERKMT